MAGKGSRSGRKAHTVVEAKNAPRALGCAKWWTPRPVQTELARSLMSRLTLDTGETWGDVIQPWQTRAYEAVLGLPGEDHEKRPMVWVDGPTGCGKDQIIAAIVLAILHHGPRGFRVVCFSTDLDRNADVIETVKGFATRDPKMGSVISNEHGDIPIEFTRDKIKAGGDVDIEIAIESCDGASASGARADLFIMNEVQSWRDPHGGRVWNETIARFGKKGGRFAVFSNAPFTPVGDWRRDQWDRARVPREQGGRWTYVGIRVKDVPWITDEYLEMQRENLPDTVFRRLFFCEPSDGRGELITSELLKRSIFPDLADLGDPEVTPWTLPGQYFAGCDVGVTRDHAVIVVLLKSPQGSIRVCRVETWVPDPKSKDPLRREVQLNEVQSRLEVFVRTVRAKLFFDPFQAVQMKQTLENAGAEVEQVAATAANLTEMAAAVISCFRDGVIRLYPDCGRVEVKPGQTTWIGQQLLDAEIKEQEKGVRVVMQRTTLGHGDQASAFMLGLLGAVRAAISSTPACVGSGTASALTPQNRTGHRGGSLLGARAGQTRRVDPWRSFRRSAPQSAPSAPSSLPLPRPSPAV